MKLEFLETNVHKSAEFKEEQFGIGDVRVIFEILRSKMYPNPIKSFTQEIMCNARDAHREVNTPNVPIVVKMPTSLDRIFSVRDYGIGIGPERMSNVFIKYGMSTKRDDNDQTGGFGLGAKSPWSYTDTFGITTWTPNDDGQMVKREYIAYIDETRIGKLSLITEETSTEVRGTMITVACKPGDEYRFIDWVKQTTEYWKVRPTIKGADIKWDDIPKAFEGTDWYTLERDSYMGSYSYRSGDRAKAIIDEIPYTLQWANLKLDGWDGDLKNIGQSLFNVPLRIHFKTGELQLTANREEIDYSDKCISVIQDRLKNIIKEFRKTIMEGIADADDLWDANMRWQMIKSNFRDIFDTSSWVDDDGEEHILTGNRVSFAKCGCIIWSYGRSSYGNTDKFKKDRWNTDNIKIEQDRKLCINDDTCERPNRRRLVTLFEKNNNALKGVDVIMLPLETAERAAALKKLREDFYIDLYKPIYLSTVVKAPVQRQTVTTASGTIAAKSTPVVTKAYKFLGDTYRKRERWDNLHNIDITTGSQVYVAVVRGEAYLDNACTNSTHINVYHLAQIHQSLGIDIYGIPKRSVHRVGPAWIKLVDAVKDKYDKLCDPVTLAMVDQVAKDSDYLFNKKLTNVSFLADATYYDQLSDDSELKKWIEVSKNAISAKDKLNQIEQFENILKNVNIQLVARTVKSKYDFVTMSGDVMKKYRLLSAIQGWGLSTVHRQAIVDYVNMIDKESQKKDGKGVKTPGNAAIMC